MFENYKQYKTIDFNDLPEMSNEIFNELLKYNLSSVEQTVPKIEKIESKKINTEEKLNDILKCIDITRFKNYNDCGA